MSEYSENPEKKTTFDPLADWHDTLQGAFANPDDRQLSLQAQRQQLRDIIARAGQQIGTESLDTYQRIVEYLWFDVHSQPLPEGVGYYSVCREDGLGEVDFDTDNMDADTFDSITGLLGRFGLDDLLQRRQEFAVQQAAEIEAAYRATVDATPTGKWLEALQVGPLRRETPLSQLERTAYERAIWYTMTSGRTAENDPRIRKPLDRRYSLLDEVTSLHQRHEANADYALQALIQRALAILAIERVDGDRVVDWHFDRDGGVLTEFAADGQELGRYDLLGLTLGAYHESGLPESPNLAWEGVSHELFGYVLSQGYADLSSFEEVYASALALLRHERFDPVLGGMALASGREVIQAIATTKRLMDQPLTDEEGAEEDDDATDEYDEPPQSEGLPTFSQEITHLSRSEYEQARRQLLGTIERHHQPVPGVFRLLQPSQIRTDLPTQPDGPVDMVVRLPDCEVDPHIIGYELVAADFDEGRFYYAYQLDKDPYRPIDLPVPAEAQARLADLYAAIGLNELATELRARDELTVADLAALVQRYSVYMLRPDDQPDMGSQLGDLETYQAFVQDERLRATSAIYCYFGDVSLAEFMERGESFVIDGFVLSPDSDDIIALPHHQVIILRDNQPLSLVEWTMGAANPPELRFVTPEQTEAMEPLSDQEIVQRSLETLLLQLRPILLPETLEAVQVDDDLSLPLPDYEELIYKRAQARGRGDPIAEALGALLRVHESLRVADELSSSDLAVIRDALGVVRRATERTQRLRGVSQQTHLLRILESALVPLARLDLD